MRLSFPGTGTLRPNERAHTSVLLEDDPLLFDCGSGVLENIVAGPVGFDAIDSVFLSHHHPDHTCGLIPLILANRELAVYGPPHTGRLIDGLLEPYRDLKRKSTIAVEELDAGDVVEVGGRQIRTMETVHNAPSLAYRVDNAFVYSGDTAPMESMPSFATGTELLIHECTYLEPDSGGNWHTNVHALASLLAGCDVPRLALAHLPSLSDAERREITDIITADFDGEVLIPDDLDTIEIDG